MSKNLLRILLFIIAFVLGAFLVYKLFITKPVDDHSAAKPAYQMSYDELFNKLSTGDSATFALYKDKLIAVSGRVNNINKSGDMNSIEIAPEGNSNTIIFQMDKRHIQDLDKVKEGDPITIKGVLSAYEPDDELGLGSTIQFKYATVVFQ